MLDFLKGGVNIKDLNIEFPKKAAENSFLGITEDYWRTLRTNLNANEEKNDYSSTSYAWLLGSLKIFAREEMLVDKYTQTMDWDKTFKHIQRSAEMSDWHSVIFYSSYLALLDPNNPSLIDLLEKNKSEFISSVETYKDPQKNVLLGNHARAIWILYPEVREKLEEDTTLFNLLMSKNREPDMETGWGGVATNAATLKIIFPNVPRTDYLNESAFNGIKGEFFHYLGLSTSPHRDSNYLLHFSILGAYLKILESDGPKTIEETQKQLMPHFSYNPLPQIPAIRSF